MLARVVTHDRGSDVPRQVVVSLMNDGVHVNTLRNAGIDVHCVGMRRGFPSPVAFFRLVSLLRQERPDVLMTWLYHADLLGTLAAPLAGVKRLIWNIRCSDVDFDSYPMSTRWTVAMLARLSGRPWAIGANSEAGRRSHEGLGYAPARWIYLPNGFDLKEWRPDAVDRAAVREELGLGPEDVGIVMVARVDPMKDHTNLLAAAAYLVERRPQVRFVLIGRGTDALALPPAFAGSVVALGERTDIPRLLRGFDIAVLSSSFGEGFPNAIGEAMSTGLPCVVTDVGDTAALVQDTGIVVPPRDPVAFAIGIDALIAEGPEATKRRGVMARERIAMHWSIERAMNAYREVWQEALGGQ